MAHEPYPFVAYDEAQDASRLEISAALAMVAPDGEFLACGDEGQAIFGGFKGYGPGERPAAWQWADRVEHMSPGYRVGRPVTEIASSVLAPHAWHDPALYSANHPTLVHHWDMTNAPTEGLVMGLSRYTVDKYIQRHDLTGVGVVPGTKGIDGLAVTTIHAAKGHESDSIYMLPWSKQKLMALDNDDPEMLKVAYVALTRARWHVWLPTDLYARWA
jgi:superfamily I DNA/RNA helicase